MTTGDHPPVGDRIREERRRLGVGLRELAREVGVSASMISQIENNKSRPSVSTLFAITTALGISVQDVFQASDVPAPTGEAGEASPATVARPAAALRTPEPVPDREDGPVVRAADRRVLGLESGVTWESLGELPVPGATVDFMLVRYPPGAASSATGERMRHRGYEYGYLVSGRLTLSLGEEEYTINAGDAMSFASTTPHRYRNDGTEPAVGIWFVLE